ncbi:hypothetical protein ABTM18_20180, partial [Acinetobacter baumannii]
MADYDELRNSVSETRMPIRKSDRPSLMPGAASLLVGATVGERYRIERVIGEGAMGAVFLAEHVHMHKRYAIKVLHPE